MEDKSQLLSCIIITYNQNKYLFEAIDSVLKQDYFDYELIIADDCSNDFNIKEIESYIESRKSEALRNYIVYTNKVNLGTVKNINKAIKKASGIYIKIFGGDDVIASNNVFSLQVNYLVNNSGLFIVTGKSIQCDESMNEIYDKYVVKNNQLIPSVISASSTDEKHKIISKNYIFPYMTQAMCFKSDFFDVYGLYDDRYQLLEDTPMMNRIIDRNISVGFQDIFTIKHRTKVGISAENIIYSSKSLRYYEDCKLLAYDEMALSKTVLERLGAWQRMRIAALRIELCKSSGTTARMKSYFIYMPNIILYFLNNPQKTFRKLTHFLKK